MKVVYIAVSIMFLSSCGMNIKKKTMNVVGKEDKNKVNLEDSPHFVANSSHYQTKIILPNSVLMGYVIDGYKPTKAQFEQMTHIAISFLRAENSSGKIVMTAFISPYSNDREEARKLIGDDFIEIFVNTSIDECIERDPKGLYKKALNGEIKGFTGIDAPYQEPLKAEIKIQNMSVEESIDLIINKLKF